LGLATVLKRAQALGIVDDRTESGDWDSAVERVRAEIRSQLVPEQLALFEDGGRWDAACCARQSGKTFTAARLLVDVAVGGPNRICLYVSDTFRHAREAMWDDQVDGLPAVLHALGLEEGRHYRINLSQLRVTFPNGSFVELQGADRGAWAGLRGRKLDLVIADEMQRQEQEGLRAALRKDVPDCLMARRGRFVGIGTVGRALRGVWFEMNAGVHGLCPALPGWTAFHWTARELRHLTNVWEEQLAYASAMGIDTESDPEWLREKLGRWVRDEQGLLHTLTERSLWDGRDLPPGVRTRCPEHHRLRLHCVCDLPVVPRSEVPAAYAGLDLGAGDGTPGGGDPCAVVVGTVSREEGVLREVHSEERAAPTTVHLVEWIRGLMDRFGVRRIYCDPAWKLTVQDLRSLYALPVEVAVKGDAEGTTEDLWHAERQAALASGLMQVRRGSVLHGQLESVLRDPALLEAGHVRQAAGQRDHALDAWRYLFRMVRTRHVQVPEAPLDPRQERELEMTRMRAEALRGPSADRRDDRQRVTGGGSRREALIRGIT